MIRRIMTLVVAALFMMALTVPAFAASPSQQQCEAQGGTFTKSGGQVKCVIVDDRG